MKTTETEDYDDDDDDDDESNKRSTLRHELSEHYCNYTTAP